ncbi:MAG: aldo/keto reductase [Acidobacteriota bacterium]
MQFREFGAAKSNVSVIGQGTWNIETSDRGAAIAALRQGLDQGLNHIDTAEMYGSGKSEQIVGEAIAGRRGEVFLVSKVLPSNASRKGTVEACERSLRQLKTAWLDCYLLHWRGRYPLAETIAAFEELQQAGKIRAWGVSNFDVGDLEEAWAVAGPGRMACNQVLYHLEERAIEHAVIPWCAERGVSVVAYSPFGSGHFPAASAAGGRALRRIAEAHGATPRQVALAFLVRWPAVFTIPKAATPEHTADNAGATNFALTSAEIAQLEAAFPLGRRPRSLPMI